MCRHNTCRSEGKTESSTRPKLCLQLDWTQEPFASQSTAAQGQPTERAYEKADPDLAPNAQAACSHTNNQPLMPATQKTPVAGQQSMHYILSSSLKTPLSRLGGMLHQGSSNFRADPMIAGGPNAADVHPPSLPASCAEVEAKSPVSSTPWSRAPMHLSAAQLQNLQKAADLLQGSLQADAQITNLQTCHTGNTFAAPPLPPAMVHQAQAQEQTEPDPPVDANDSVTPPISSITSACQDRCPSAMHSSAAAEAFSDDLEAADLVIVLLQNRLQSMAPALPALCVNTIPVLGTDNMPQADHPEHKQLTWVREANGKPGGSDLLPRHLKCLKENVSVHQDAMASCAARNQPISGQWTGPVQLAQPAPTMQRKRFRKTTGLEVLYRTMPLCRQAQ